MSGRKNRRIPGNEEALGALQILAEALAGRGGREGLAWPAFRAAMAIIDVRWRGCEGRLSRKWKERLRELGIDVGRDGRLEIVSVLRFSHAVSIAGQTERCPLWLFLKRLESGCEPWEPVNEEDWPKRGKTRYCKSGVIEKEPREKKSLSDKLKRIIPRS